MKKFTKTLFPILAAGLLLFGGCERAARNAGSSSVDSTSGIVYSSETPADIQDLPGNNMVSETTASAIPAETPAPTQAIPETVPETAPETAPAPDTTEAEFVVTPADDYIYSTTDKVNVRLYPDTSGGIAGQVMTGNELKRTGTLDTGWSQVEYQGQTCYVYTELFTTVKPETTEAPTTTEPAATEPAATDPVTAIDLGSIPGTGIMHGGQSGPLVAIDAGHQLYGDSSQEPNGPGSSVMKARVTSGTQGVSTGVTEYQLNLDVSLKLRDELVARGYNVLMIRETNDVSISNAERATLANNYGADIFLRVHANGVDDSSVRGTLTMAPSTSNPYCSGIASASQYLCALITDAMCAQTGFNNKGVQIVDNMTGINWCQMPVAIIEMGFMSSPAEDEAMQQSSVQYQMVEGIANAVDTYFGR